MNKYEGLECPVCKAKLFEDDDIAVCPECGAPAHRECYLREGHCHFEQFHGTDNQWQMPHTAPAEPEAPNTNPNPAENPFFGEPTVSIEDVTDPSGINYKIEFVGNIDKDEVIDGVRATDVAAFVGYNAGRYLKIFRQMAYTKSKVGWNWLAFLIPEYWLLARKCYKAGTLAVFFKVLLSTLLYLTVGTSSELYNLLSSVSRNPSAFFGTKQFIVMAAIGGVSLIFSIIIGLFGDYIYKRKVYGKIAELNSEGIKDPLSYFRVGGVNVFIPLAVWFFVDIITQLIVSFVV